MGCCAAATDEGRLNAFIDSELSVALKTDTNIKKLVLLGAGGSGKSTFFKQLRAIHGKGYTDKDRIPFKKHVFHQVVQEMKRMIRFAEDLIEEDPRKYAAYKLSDDNVEQREFFKQLRDDAPITAEIAQSVEALWRDPGLAHVYKERAQFAVTDSTAFFLDEIQRVASPDYVPTYQDVLLCRHRSIGIADKLFIIKQTQFRIFDVGGQRAERRKWIHCFEHVTAVTYVVSLSGYNEAMYEDETENVMVDSLRLFEKTCNNEWFKETSMILFLNKYDLFEEKIKNIQITSCFEEYEGPFDYKGSIKEIKRQFKLRNHQVERPMYFHITCAVDKGNVERVFNDVQHLLVSSKLDTEGLL